MSEVLLRLSQACRRLCAWVSGTLLAAFNAYLTHGVIVPSHRDYGDETDFDVVTSGPASAPSDSGRRTAEVNRKPMPDPVIGISRGDKLVAVLDYGVKIGDFVYNVDDSIQPVLPEPGEINHTWVRLLIGELLVAMGRDPDSPELADFPERAADLLGDLVA